MTSPTTMVLTNNGSNGLTFDVTAGAVTIAASGGVGSFSGAADLTAILSDIDFLAGFLEGTLLVVLNGHSILYTAPGVVDFFSQVLLGNIPLQG